VLWGKSAGGAGNNGTGRVFTTPSIDLLTQNMAASTYPLAFTTAIAASTLPASVDPFVDFVATSLNTVLVARLRKT
jgi:hypothetical protein